MTVPSTTRRAGPYSGNGIANTFSFTFKTFDAGDLSVIKTSSSGNESTLVKDSDYSVSLNVDQDTSPGGTVTYPITGTKLASGEKLTILSALEYEQTTDLLGGGAFNARVIEDTFDRVTVQIQQVLEEVSRGVQFPRSDESSLNPVLPTAEQRAGKYLAFDESGNVAASASNVEELAASASASESSAASSAASAASSATSALGSATSATAALASVQATATALAPTVSVFSGTGSQTAFTMPFAVTSKNLIDIYIGGVYQQKSMYSTLGTTLTFTEAPPFGVDNIEVQTAANVTFQLPASADYGLITALGPATEDYGALF